jgi:hypothetical protein
MQKIPIIGAVGSLWAIGEFSYTYPEKNGFRSLRSLYIRLRLFQNFSIEKAAFENSSFVEPLIRGRRPKNCKRFD